MMDFNKFPILYEEEIRKAVEDFIFEKFDSQKETDEENFICHEITSEYVHSDVYNFDCSVLPNTRVYVSCGMGARSQNSLRPGYDHIELMMFGSENLKNDIDVMNQLVNLSKYPFRTSSWLGPFHTIDVTEKIKEKFGYSYLWFLPEIFGELDVEDSLEAYTIKFLPLVPLYEEERNVLARMDDASEELRDSLLEAIREDISMFHIDVPRPNFAPDTEPEVEIPDELREAFARDIKDMLQEFIDMGDIDYEDDEDCEDE